MKFFLFFILSIFVSEASATEVDPLTDCVQRVESDTALWKRVIPSFLLYTDGNLRDMLRDAEYLRKNAEMILPYKDSKELDRTHLYWNSVESCQDFRKGLRNYLLKYLLFIGVSFLTLIACFFYLVFARRGKFPS